MTEKRLYPRTSVRGLTALVTVYSVTSAELWQLSGDVLDMSYAGIKIKLSSPMPDLTHEHKIKIVVSSPHTTVPMVINGKIRHHDEQAVVGLSYLTLPSQQQVDRLIFECRKAD